MMVQRLLYVFLIKLPLGDYKVKHMGNILIVEDEAIHLMYLKSILINNGFTICDTSSTGEYAITSANNNSIDIALMDISLNGHINGIDASIKIREKFNFPILFMTGYEDESTLEKVENIKNSSILIKPILETDLLDALTNLLNS